MYEIDREKSFVFADEIFAHFCLCIINHYGLTLGFDHCWAE